MPQRGHAAATSQRRPSSRSRVGAARRSLALGTLLGGVLIGALGAQGLVPTLTADVAAAADTPALDVAGPDAPGAAADVADQGAGTLAAGSSVSGATGPAPTARTGEDASRAEGRAPLPPSGTTASAGSGAVDADGDDALESGSTAQPVESAEGHSGEPAATDPAGAARIPAGAAEVLDALVHDTLNPAAADARATARDGSEQGPAAAATDRDALVEALGTAQARLESVPGVLTDGSLAPALENEIGATQTLLARWPAGAPAETAPFVQPRPSSSQQPQTVIAAPSLLQVVPSAAAAASRLEALSAATEAVPLIETADGVTRVNGVVVVNKTFGLGPDYNPGLTPELLAAFDTMVAGAKQDGIHLWIGSGFRSYLDQKAIYGGYEAKHGTERADRFSARPGHSEHQSGLAIDVNQVHRGFSGTAAAAWVAAHAHEYGFVVRFPEGKEHATGYAHESWHLRYLGVELATELAEQGVSLEEYLGVTSTY